MHRKRIHKGLHLNNPPYTVCRAALTLKKATSLMPQLVHRNGKKLKLCPSSHPTKVPALVLPTRSRTEPKLEQLLAKWVKMRSKQKLFQNENNTQALRTEQRRDNHSLRIRFLRFWKLKNVTFYIFWSGISKKRNPKFEVSDFADFSLDGISTTAQKQCMFIIYMALVLSSCIKDNKSDWVWYLGLKI